MESLQTEDGQHFTRSLAAFIRQHEKALANSLQLSVSRKQSPNNASATNLSSPAGSSLSSPPYVQNSSLATAFSLAGLRFMSHNIKPAHLTLTPHHMFYLLSRIEELGIPIGPMNVRLENIHTDPSPSNYVSFLQSHKAPITGRSDRDSIHSVSSVRSVMSGMSAFWSSIGLGSHSSKSEKARAAVEVDLKYLYSAFTKLPSLRLAPDHRARLIKGYEEFPFDTAVPLFAFKNIQQLEIIDMDFRQFCGWDRLADQLTLLTVKRARVDDPADLITNIVLDDAEKRRRRSNKAGNVSPTSPWTVPSTPRAEWPRSNSDPGSPITTSPANIEGKDVVVGQERSDTPFRGSVSPKRPSPSRPNSSYRHVRTYSSRVKRSESGSSNSSDYTSTPHRCESASNLLSMNVLAPSKWQRLKYLSLADNALTHLSAKSILPLATSLRSLNLASNLFTEIPDSLALLSRLNSLDLSNCMIESLQSLSRNPLPAISTLKLKSNRLRSLAGIERLLSLENLNIQDNRLSDPTEAARLTGIPNLRRLWVKQNPFTKRHSDYRITIFNLFRRTPGYLEDLVIDDYEPTYVERKLLLDRAPEVQRQPTARSIRIAEPPLRLQQQDQEQQSVHAIEPIPEPQPSPGLQPDPATNSTRRRRGARRRIVDLSREDDAPAPLNDPAESVGPVDSAEAKAFEIIANGGPSMEEQLHLLGLKHGGTFKGDSQVPAPEQNTHNDDYRARVEALRREFGTNWISVLGDQQWRDHRHVPELVDNDNDHHHHHHSPLHRTTSHAIVSSGRTLG